MYRRIVSLVLFCATILIGACDKAPPAQAPALLKVAERTISLEEFQHEFSQVIPDDQSLSTDEELSDLKRAFLRQLVDRELTLAEADRLAITVSPAELERRVGEYRRDYPAGEFERMLGEQQLSFQQWQDDLRDRLRMEKVVNSQVYKRLKVDPKEIEEYYRGNRKTFDRPQQVRARQIVVAGEEEGQRLLGLLRQGEDFASVAKAHSLSPDGEKGGDLGFFARGEMPPEFDDVVFSLPAGRLSDLVKTDYGYHIFLVEEKRPAQSLSLDQVQEQIEAVLLDEKKEAAYNEWLQGLGSRAVIEVNWALLNNEDPAAKENK